MTRIEAETYASAIEMGLSRREAEHASVTCSLDALQKYSDLIDAIFERDPTPTEVEQLNGCAIEIAGGTDV